MSGQNKEPPKYTPLPPTQQLGATPQGVGNMEELGRMESMEKGVWGQVLWDVVLLNLLTIHAMKLESHHMG